VSGDRGAGYEYFDAEADAGIRAWAGDRAGAFAEAARGMFALIVDPASVEDRERREVRAQAASAEPLLVTWINECLYVHEIEGFAVTSVEITVCEETLVHGFLRGENFDPERHRTGTIVKAATFHRVSVKELDGRVEVSLSLKRDDGPAPACRSRDDRVDDRADHRTEPFNLT
jgi:SHS2 domain-containing protein